jgi:hypothetical protein
MKNILFIFILLFSSSFANAQLFKSTPKKYSDLAFFHKRAITTDAEIISINEINLPNVEKVFPKAKLCDIFMEGRSFTGKVQSHAYFLLYKGKYYGNDDFSYLSEIEQKANKNKISPLSLKERAEAYANVAFYNKLKAEIKTDSMVQRTGTKTYEYDIPYTTYDVYYNINGAKYTGIFDVFDSSGYAHTISIMLENKKNFWYLFENPQLYKDKSININILNTEPPEMINLNNYYYFDITKNPNAQVEVTGLDPNENIHLYFFCAYEVFSQSVEIYDILLTANSQGKAYYNYSESTCKSGVYKFRVIRADSSHKDISYPVFAPEHRLEANLSTGFKYRIYYTDMFYNSAAIEKWIENKSKKI